MLNTFEQNNRQKDNEVQQLVSKITGLEHASHFKDGERQ